jgi:DNA-binding transcriptional LysR family regulator
MAELDPNPLSGADLAAFVVAVEAGSVHGAADALRMTPSAVTKRVQALERRLGVTLFERGRFGLRQTEAGRALYPEAKQALIALGEAERAVAGGAGAAIEFAASHTIGEFLLPGWLAAYRATHPALRAKVDIAHSQGVLEAVRERRVEIGFVEGLDELGDLEALVVHRDELVVVVAREHRWGRRRGVAAGELADEPYFARELGSGTRSVAAAALAGAGVELSPSLESASTQSVKRALGPVGFAILSRLTVEADGPGGGLHALAVRDVDMGRELRAVREPRRRPSPAAAEFWRWLRTLEPAP